MSPHYGDYYSDRASERSFNPHTRPSLSDRTLDELESGYTRESVSTMVNVDDASYDRHSRPSHSSHHSDRDRSRGRDHYDHKHGHRHHHHHHHHRSPSGDYMVCDETMVPHSRGRSTHHPDDDNYVDDSRRRDHPHSHSHSHSHSHHDPRHSDSHHSSGRPKSKSRNVLDDGRVTRLVEAAVVGGAVEALRSRHHGNAIPRALTAAAGAAATDMLVGSKGKGGRHGKANLAESAVGGLVVDRLINGRH